MKTLLLLFIRFYWKMIPADKRNRCIYRHSCSNYVFDATKAHGFMIGVRALSYRMKRCNPYFEIFKNPMTGDTEIILSTGDVLGESEIANRFIN